jgi:hypothetical protein
LGSKRSRASFNFIICDCFAYTAFIIGDTFSEKSKTICFVTNKGHVRYLTFDKEGVLYEMMKAKCSNRLDEETFKTNYPKIKI